MLTLSARLARCRAARWATASATGAGFDRLAAARPGGLGDRRQLTAARLSRRRLAARFQPCGDFLGGQRAEQAQQVRDALHPAHPAVRRQALELPFGGLDDLGIQQFAQLHPAQELVQQGGVQGQRGGPALRQRGVALVEELGDVAEQQGLGER